MPATDIMHRSLETVYQTSTLILISVRFSATGVTTLSPQYSTDIFNSRLNLFPFLAKIHSIYSTQSPL